MASKLNIIGAVVAFLAAQADDSKAAVALGLDVEDIRHWRASIAAGAIEAAVELGDFDGDGDVEPRFRIRWNGKRHERVKRDRARASKRDREPKTPAIKTDKRGLWRDVKGRVLRQKVRP